LKYGFVSWKEIEEEMDSLGSIYVGASSCFAGVIGKIDLEISEGLLMPRRGDVMMSGVLMWHSNSSIAYNYSETWCN
jgi:hypothetical protein